jgi:hypothetical protein
MDKITIDLDYEVVDEIVQGQLVRSWESLKLDLGAGNSVFVWGDPEADDVEIQKRLDAFEHVIKWYSTPEQLRELGLKGD